MAQEHTDQQKQEKKLELVPKSFTLFREQLEDIESLAAYNKLIRKKPDSASAVVREAIDQYLSSTDKSFRKFVR